MNKEVLGNIYDELEIQYENTNLITDTVKHITTSIINGESSELITRIIDEGIIDIVGDIDEPVDYIIIAGGVV